MSGMPSDDLAALFVQPDREHAGRAQGIVVEWNPDTAENVVEVHGTRFRNLALEQPLLTFSLQPRSVVMVERWRPRSGRGSATYSISGQWLPPGEGRATQAIAFMASTFAKQISNEVFAEGVLSQDVTATESTSSTLYTDLATEGPTIADVEISGTGKAIVFVSAGMQSSFTNRGCRMGFEVSGATSQDPTNARSAAAIFPATPFDVAVGRSFALNGLNPGTHSFQAKYRSHAGTEVFFYDRSLVVIAL